MNDLFHIGQTGLSAYKTALSAIGDNVANAETPGYSRRSVHMKQLNVFSARSVTYREESLFAGVEAFSVERAWDAFRAADARLAASSAGSAATRKQWLTSLETALDDGPAGIGQTITGFFNAAQTLSATPRDIPSRVAMLAKLDEFTMAVRRTSDGIDRLSDSVTTAAQGEVDALNLDIQALAKVNSALRQSTPGNNARAALEDQRDSLIDSIATRIDVSVAVDETGAATLTLARASGVTLLDPAFASVVGVVPALDGRLSLELYANGTTVPLPATGGTLAGLTEVAANLADRRNELTSMVTDFMNAINTWSQAGLDRAGNPGAPMLTMAAGLQSLTLVTTDPAAIAAASAGAENGNLLTLDTLRGVQGIEQRWTAMVTSHAHILSATNAEDKAATNRRDNAYAALDEVTGVDPDREAAELMRYQKAYEGAARIIQVARETVDSILNLF
ncbi:flagellar hook-associated protein FlgK [Allosphingosinicella vermicomposti]|uniref:flagellar hook-associated protein FlgK n=1 Tax=Allosphingosinicella vermicomposti TaxID=614671 RepID=UPI000D0E8506|nr:flagellar hook-associated protein FlgK [Allosphingosinicella vermicomposti]